MKNTKVEDHMKISVVLFRGQVARQLDTFVYFTHVCARDQSITSADCLIPKSKNHYLQRKHSLLKISGTRLGCPRASL